MADLVNIRNDLADFHSAHPQLAALADHAIEGIRTSLDSLARLGHKFDLVRVGVPVGTVDPRQPELSLDRAIEMAKIKSPEETPEPAGTVATVAPSVPSAPSVP